MYKLTIDRAVYIKKALAYYRSLAGGRNKQELIKTMTYNGVLMTPHLCGWYYELPLDAVLKVLEENTKKGLLSPVFGSLDIVSCFYLRSDLWELAPSFQEAAIKGKIQNTRSRISDAIVDTGDMAFYHGVSRTVITKSILPKLRPKVIPTGNTRQVFYYWQEIVEMESSLLFRDTVNRSHQAFSAYTVDRKDVRKVAVNSKLKEAQHTDGFREDKIIFRDTECPRYDDCASFAVITDYMDCSLCVHNTQKIKMRVSGIYNPSCVFMNPRSKRHLQKLQNIECFPNQIDK